MAGYVFGIGVLAFAAWQLWSHRTPPGGIEFEGSIVEELSKKSTRAGDRRLSYAPRVAYRHPATGADEVYEPSAFTNHRFTVGEQTTLVYDPAKERVFRPLDRPVKGTIVLTLVGLGFIAAQFYGG